MPSIINASTSTGLVTTADTSGVLQLQTGGTTAVTVDASQNVGIGVTPSAWSLITPLQVKNASFAGYLNRAYVFANSYFDGSSNKYIASDFANYYVQQSGQHQWYNAASGTAGNAISFTQAMTLDASGRLLVGTTGDISAGGYFGAGQFRGSFPAIVISGTETSARTWQIAENAGSITFYDTTGGERVRIDTSGNLLVGKTASSTLSVGVESRPDGIFIATRSASTNATETMVVYSTGVSALRFYVGMGGTVYATSTTISAISDQRLKENVQDLDVGLDKIMALKPRKFDWKEGKGKDIKGDRGWIAQEFEQVFPDMVDEWRDPAPEGEDPYKSVRADLIPVLVKAIQEQQAIIQTLTDRITALEGTTP
jgi:hypothetical protein